MFTTDQRNVLIGSILGDGGIYLTSSKPHFYFKQKESSKDYVFWIYNYFHSFCKSPPKKRVDNNQWYFRTRGVELLSEFHRNFYDKNGRKKFHRKLKTYLPLLYRLQFGIWTMEPLTIDKKVIVPLL